MLVLLLLLGLLLRLLRSLLFLLLRLCELLLALMLRMLLHCTSKLLWLVVGVGSLGSGDREVHPTTGKGFGQAGCCH